MLSKVRQTIELHRMVAPGDKILVAVSGGLDSLVLLQLLYELREELGVFLIVSHLDHRIRGAESRADAEFVAAKADKLGLPLVLEDRDVPAYSREHGLSLEEAAREVRYRFLERTFAKVEAEKVALGHHRDDLAESLLINLIRGAGLPGLRGMAPVRGQFIRPLIQCSRAEIEEFARDRGLEYRQDRTNLERRYLRNRVRQELLPLLEDYRSHVSARLAQTAQILGQAADYLEGIARRRLQEIIIEKSNQELVLERKGILRERPPLRAFILREAVRSFRGTLRDIEFDHLQGVLQLIETGKSGAELHLPGKLCFRCSGAKVSFALMEKPVERPKPQYYEIPLQLGGNFIPELGWRFRLEEAPPGRGFPGDRLQELIDRDRIEEPLMIRNWRPGDRFRPLGMRGTKKLQDLFVDSKVKVEERGRIPLLCDRQGIVWVVGLRLSEDYKVTHETKRALKVTARKLGVEG